MPVDEASVVAAPQPGPANILELIGETPNPDDEHTFRHGNSVSFPEPLRQPRPFIIEEKQSPFENSIENEIANHPTSFLKLEKADQAKADDWIGKRITAIKKKQMSRTPTCSSFVFTGHQYGQKVEFPLLHHR